MNKADRIAKEHGLTASEVRSIAASRMGAIGGANGKGECKRRSPEHYKAMVAARNKQREERRRAKEEAAK